MTRREVQNETSPPTISASGRRRCRATGGVADREGAILSDAAGAVDRAIPSGRRGGLVLASHRSTIVGAAWPTGHYREPSGRGWKRGNRGGRACVARRLHTTSYHFHKRDKPNAIRQAEFRFRARHCSSRQHRSRDRRLGGAPFVPC